MSVDTRLQDELTNLKSKREELRQQSDKRSDGNHTGGNGGGSDLEARVAKLETHVEYIRRDLDVIVVDLREHRKETRSDFRILFGALITAALGLAAIMAKGFGWL